MTLQPWFRRWIPLGVVMTTLGGIALTCAAAESRSVVDESALAARARRIHAAVLTLDSHVDVLLPPATPEATGDPQQASFEQLVRGGIDAVALSIAVGPSAPADFAAQVRALRIRYDLAQEFPSGPLGFAAGSEVLPAERRQAFIADFKALYPKASVKEFVNHIEHIVHRIGIEHVGIGSDFNHGAGIVGFEDESEAPNVTLELVRRGYDRDQIAKIWGGNFLRVFAQVQAVSQRESERPALDHAPL